MTRRRWIADEVTGDRAALVEAHADHLVRVLRARVGQEFDISAGGRVRRGRIASVTPQRVEFELAEDVPASAAPQIHLYLAVFKFDRFEWAVEKATELGAARIVLAESEQGTTLKDALASAAEPVLLAIGPEGGWTSDELRQFTESGWISSGLGPTVLRAETAAVAAVAIAVCELATGD